jgi:hypothetical protein
MLVDSKLLSKPPDVTQIENYEKIADSLNGLFNQLPANSPIRSSFIKTLLSSCDTQFSSELLGITAKNAQRV